MPATANDIDAIIRKLEKQGVKVQETGKKQVRKLTLPDNKVLFVHQTPSDRNWEWNLRRSVEKSGVVWPGADSKATKAALKAHASAKPPIPDNWERPKAPFEHVMVPPGVGYFNAYKSHEKKPADRHIGYVRGALFKIGNPETFWTASVTDELREVPGFRGGTSTEAQGVLDWLGYRVVEARKYKVGHIYRWMLDPTKDRAAREVLPMYVPRPAEAAVKPETPQAEPETPTAEPEPASEAQEPAEGMLDRHAKAYKHFEAEVERLTGIAEQHRQAEVDLRRQRDEFRAEAVQLRALLTATEEERDRLREQSPQDDKQWPAIDFKGEATWTEIQQWATSFGLDVQITLRRAE